LFTALVKDFLGIQLQIDEVEHDKVFSPPVGNVATKFDLFAEYQKNRVIVKVQHAHYSDTYERFVYYQCSAMVETIASSDNYILNVVITWNSKGVALGYINVAPLGLSGTRSPNFSLAASI